jgi:hypothetical protein
MAARFQPRTSIAARRVGTLPLSYSCKKEIVQLQLLQLCIVQYIAARRKGKGSTNSSKNGKVACNAFVAWLAEQIFSFPEAKLLNFW